MAGRPTRCLPWLPVLFWLAGCAGRVSVSEQPMQWQVQGRAALTVAGESARLRFHAWRQGSELWMEVLAPLAQGRWRMGLGEDGPWLRDGRGLWLEGEAVDEWLSAQLGVPVSLRAWFHLLRNRPPAQLADLGWSLRVEVDPQRPRCPNRLELLGREGRIVLSMKQWQGRCD